MTAKKEWQMDCQGMDHLDYHRFQLCFFQIADAWSKTTTASAYIKVLTDLMNRTSFKDRETGKRKWKVRRGAWRRRACTNETDPPQTHTRPLVAVEQGRWGRH